MPTSLPLPLTHFHFEKLRLAFFSQPSPTASPWSLLILTAPSNHSMASLGKSHSFNNKSNSSLLYPLPLLLRFPYHLLPCSNPQPYLPYTYHTSHNLQRLSSHMTFNDDDDDE